MRTFAPWAGLSDTCVFFFSSRRRHTRLQGDWSSDVCSSDLEESRDGVSLPSYRGDNINHPEFTAAARRPDPQLLLRGYERASLTLNFVRALEIGRASCRERV